MTRITAAVVQAGSYLFDTAKTLESVHGFIREAVDKGARLAVLPEAFLGGYPKGMDFGVAVGSRSPAGRDEFRRYFDSAVVVPGPETEELAALAGDLNCRLVVGAIERRGSTLYCVVLFFDPEAGLVGIHRKLMPTAAERLIWGFGDGSTMPVIDLGYARLGAAICWENYMPLFRAAMYGKGVDIWCAPTVDDRENWQATMRHVALEGRCFVLSACQYLTRSRMPTDVHPIQGDDLATVLVAGGSVMISPLGEVLAGPLHGGEGVLVAELDLDDISRARFDFDVTGHYARPDIFTLTVDDRIRNSVNLRGIEPGASSGV